MPDRYAVGTSFTICVPLLEKKDKVMEGKVVETKPPNVLFRLSL